MEEILNKDGKPTYRKSYTETYLGCFEKTELFEYWPNGNIKSHICIEPHSDGPCVSLYNENGILTREKLGDGEIASYRYNSEGNKYYESYLDWYGESEEKIYYYFDSKNQPKARFNAVFWDEFEFKSNYDESKCFEQNGLKFLDNILIECTDKKTKSITIPASVNQLCPLAFSECSNLEEVILQNGIEYIPTRLFSNCSSLKKIVLPESVIFIDRGAFRYCQALEEIIIPSKVKVIEQAAFYNCTSLSKVTFNGVPDLIDMYSFGKCPKLNIETFPHDVPGITLAKKD